MSSWPERPLSFVVRAADGSIIDAFTEDDLASVAAGVEGKSWQEAAAWAYLAWRQWERLNVLTDS